MTTSLVRKLMRMNPIKPDNVRLPDAKGLEILFRLRANGPIHRFTCGGRKGYMSESAAAETIQACRGGRQPVIVHQTLYVGKQRKL